MNNVRFNSRSVTKIEPTITDKTTVSFSTTLTNPGEFYEFTIDVVNDGSIDAMIDSVTKTPELSATQSKYLNYIIEYQNGESINTKQLVSKKSFVRLKVKLEFRKDITASDLPKQSETVNLSFKVNYVQSDSTGVNVLDNGVWHLTIVSGDLDTKGSEVAIGDEHFYIMSSNETSVIMLAKMNITKDDIPRQSSDVSAIEFSSTAYWENVSNGTYVYNHNSSIYNYVENYRAYLESYGATIEDARLITLEELEMLGCSKSNSTCSNAPDWVYGTSYWTGSNSDGSLYHLLKNSRLYHFVHSMTDWCGMRPVIIVSKGNVNNDDTSSLITFTIDGNTYQTEKIWFVVIGFLANIIQEALFLVNLKI